MAGALGAWRPMSGAIKKKLGFTITSEKTEAGRVYRASQGAGA